MADKTSRYRKISLNIAEEVYDDLKNLAERGKIPSVSELIRRGIALQRFVIEARQRGETLVVADKKGRVLREVVLLYDQ